MKIKITPADRAKYEAALATLCPTCDEYQQKIAENKRLHELMQQSKDRLAVTPAADLSDDKVVLALIVDRERMKLAGEKRSGVLWWLDHATEQIHSEYNAAFGLVCAPVNDLIAATASDLVEQLKTTLSVSDARHAAENSTPVKQLRQLIETRFLSENAAGDQFAEGLQRIRILLTAYLSEEWDQKKVLAEMNAVGRAA